MDSEGQSWTNSVDPHQTGLHCLPLIQHWILNTFISSKIDLMKGTVGPKKYKEKSKGCDYLG